MSTPQPKDTKNDPDKKSSETTDYTFLDQTLRPHKWDEYIGQANLKENLKILLTAASERKHPPEHILFYGPPSRQVA